MHLPSFFYSYHNIYRVLIENSAGYFFLQVLFVQGEKKTRKKRNDNVGYRHLRPTEKKTRSRANPTGSPGDRRGGVGVGATGGRRGRTLAVESVDEMPRFSKRQQPPTYAPMTHLGLISPATRPFSSTLRFLLIFFSREMTHLRGFRNGHSLFFFWRVTWLILSPLLQSAIEFCRQSFFINSSLNGIWDTTIWSLISTGNTIASWTIESLFISMRNPFRFNDIRALYCFTASKFATLLSHRSIGNQVFFFRYFSLWILMQLDGMASPRVRTIWTQSPGPFDYAPGRQMNDCSRISNWRDPPLFMASGLLAFIIGSEVRIFSNESTPTCLSSARFFFLGPSLHWTNDDSLFSLFFSKSIL